MSASTSIDRLWNPRLPAAAALPAAVMSAAIIGDAASAVIATIGHSAGVAHSFKPLQFGTYTGLVVLGVLAGAIGWQVIRTRAARPDRVLNRLVPAVLMVSFIPDVLLGITKGENATWGGVAALVGMHIVVAAAAVASYVVFLPVHSRSAQ